MKFVAFVLLAATIAAKMRPVDAFLAQRLSSSRRQLRSTHAARFAAANPIPRLTFPDLPKNVLRKHDPLNYLVYVEDALEPKPTNYSAMLQYVIAVLKRGKFRNMHITEAGVNATLAEIDPFLQTVGGNVRVVSADQDNDIAVVEMRGTLAAKPANPSLRAAVVKQYLKTRLMFRPTVIVIDKSFDRLTLQTVDDILEGVRQYIAAAGGGTLAAESLDAKSLRPVVKLRLDAPADLLDLFKQEITYRLQRIFWSPKLGVEWL